LILIQLWRSFERLDINNDSQMRTVTKIVMRAGLVIVTVYLVLLLLAHSIFVIARIGSNSMSPLIASNDVVVATKWFHTASLHNGDLVVVNLPLSEGHNILTIRKIEQQTNTPSGQFYLLAMRTNGVDSRFLGALPAADIRGKVIWIAKEN
jgi:signal peptidase I